MSKKRIIISVAVTLALLIIAGGIIFGLNRAANNPEQLISLGEKYLLEQNYEQALVQFLKVIEIDPMNPRGYTGAAEAYVGLGRTDEAIAVLQRGFDVTGDTSIQNMLNHVENDLSQEDASIDKYFTAALLGDDEITINGVVPWNMTVDDIAELFPNDQGSTVKEREWSDGLHKDYTVMQSADAWISVTSKIKNPTFEFFTSRNVMGTQIGFRDICFGDSFNDVMLKIGMSEIAVDELCDVIQISVNTSQDEIWIDKYADGEGYMVNGITQKSLWRVFWQSEPYGNYGVQFHFDDNNLLSEVVIYIEVVETSFDTPSISNDNANLSGESAITLQDINDWDFPIGQSIWDFQDSLNISTFDINHQLSLIADNGATVGFLHIDYQGSCVVINGDGIITGLEIASQLSASIQAPRDIMLGMSLSEVMNKHMITNKDAQRFAETLKRENEINEDIEIYFHTENNEWLSSGVIHFFDNVIQTKYYGYGFTVYYFFNEDGYLTGYRIYIN